MQHNGNNRKLLLIVDLLRGGTSMDRIIWLSALTYCLLIASLIFSYYVSKGRYRTIVIVIVIGIGSLVILTWALINNMIMDYQDANIGLGLVFILIWIITSIAFLFSVITYSQTKRNQNSIT